MLFLFDQKIWKHFWRLIGEVNNMHVYIYVCVWDSESGYGVKREKKKKCASNVADVGA